MIHNSSKITAMKLQRNNFIIRDNQHMRNYIKGDSIRKVENHDYRI